MIVLDHTRQRGRSYYRDLCFKVNAHVCGTLEEIGDGGFTDWTRQLAASNKERLLISGIGVDRLAAFARLLAAPARAAEPAWNNDRRGT